MGEAAKGECHLGKHMFFNVCLNWLRRRDLKKFKGPLSGTCDTCEHYKQEEKK